MQKLVSVRTEWKRKALFSNEFLAFLIDKGTVVEHQ